MTKSGLIESVAEKTPHISKKDTEIVVNTIFDAMTRRAQARRAHRDPRLRYLPGQGARGARRPESEDRRDGEHPGQADALLQGRQGAEGDGGRGRARHVFLGFRGRTLRLSAGARPIGVPPMLWLRRLVWIAFFVAILVFGWSFAHRNAEPGPRRLPARNARRARLGGRARRRSCWARSWRSC